MSINDNWRSPSFNSDDEKHLIVTIRDKTGHDYNVWSDGSHEGFGDSCIIGMSWISYVRMWAARVLIRQNERSMVHAASLLSNDSKTPSESGDVIFGGEQGIAPASDITSGDINASIGDK